MVNLYAKYEHPENGTDYDKKNMENFIVGQFYKVESISMGQSHTSVYLYDINGVYNSVMFEFYDKTNEGFIKHNIYIDPDYNPYI